MRVPTPPWLGRVLLRFCRLGDRRDDVEADLSELFQKRLTALGPREARRRFNADVVSMAVSLRPSGTTRVVEELQRDVMAALRGLRHSPGFAATVIGTLAIGVMLPAVASTVARVYLLDPLPAPASDRLYHVWYSGEPGPNEPRGLRLLDWRSLADVVEVADASVYARFMFVNGGSARELVGLRVSHASVDALGLGVTLGRSLTAEDFDSGEPPVLLGHHFWLDRFGGNDDVIGSSITLSPTGSSAPPLRYRVVGVAAPGLRYVREFSRPPVDVVTTLVTPGTAYMVRLREGVTAAEVEHRISGAITSTAGIVPPDNWRGVRLESVHDRHVAPIRPVLTAVWVASLCVFALVAANVAILVLLRSLRKQREAAVRIALGASRWRLLRSLAVEGTVVAIAATALSGFGAGVILRRLTPVLAETLGRVAPGGTPAVHTVTGMLVVAIALIGVVIIGWTVLGAMAIHRATSHQLSASRTTTDRPSIRWARTALLVFQAAASIALVTGCALMIRSASGLLTVDLGMMIGDVWRSRVALPRSAFPDPQTQQAFFERLLRTADDAGLTVGLASWPLLVEAARPQDLEVSGGRGEPVRAATTAITGGYLNALGIPVLDGRSLNVNDRLGADPAAVVSASFAARTWPGLRAIGQRVRTVSATVAGEPFGEWRTVVGVVADVRQMPDDEDRHDVYVPFLQRVPPLYATVVMTSRTGLMTAPDAARRFEAISQSADTRAVVGPVTPLSAEFDRLAATPRLLAWLLTGFGVFATVLTMVGVYGTTAHAVTQREGELAIRMALGASHRHVTGLLLGTATSVLALGSVAGVIGSATLGRLLSTQLFHVTAFEPGLTAGVVIGTAVCLVMACVIPILRARSITPARLLRDL
jgi:putative ABC transport system permease protein